MSAAAKVAIITGASSGIGRGIAELFAKANYALTLCGRNHMELEKTAQLCRSNGSKDDEIVTIAGDVTSDDVTQCIVDSALKKFGRVDVLVNNAGIVLPGSATSGLKMEDYDKVIQTNLRSVVSLTLKALDSIMKTKGCIVNISSICGLRPMPSRVFYGMSKAALDMFTKTMALDLAPHQIRVNSVNPGFVPTNIHKRSPGYNEASLKEFHEAVMARIPYKRAGTVEEIANAVLFLASDRASYITGQTLAVDGAIAL